MNHFVEYKQKMDHFADILVIYISNLVTVVLKNKAVAGTLIR